ncbi:MAG: hypothetical protein VB042_05250 [Victivallaceae bacterium]|nr:hypothetical protein [Victivallaceae bacterium]
MTTVLEQLKMIREKLALDVPPMVCDAEPESTARVDVGYELNCIIAQLDHVNQGAYRIMAERWRQIEVEGFDAKHDRRHGRDDLALAGAIYAISSTGRSRRDLSALWPWSWHWFRPSTQLRDLEKAGALIAAAIDRLLAEGGNQ